MRPNRRSAWVACSASSPTIDRSPARHIISSKRRSRWRHIDDETSSPQQASDAGNQQQHRIRRERIRQRISALMINFGLIMTTVNGRPLLLARAESSRCRASHRSHHLQRGKPAIADDAGAKRSGLLLYTGCAQPLACRREPRERAHSSSCLHVNEHTRPLHLARKEDWD